MNCLVTGGSRGIGLAIAQRVAAAGYGVTLAARNADLLVKEASGLPKVAEHQHHDVWALDMADLQAVRDLKAAPRPMAEYSAFVNCAGIAGVGLLATQPVSAVERTLSVNLHAPIVLAKHIVRAWLRRSKTASPTASPTASSATSSATSLNRKHLVFMSSVLAARGMPGSSVYSASKAGLEGFARSLAREVGSRGIAVNCIAPGLVDTDMGTRADPQFMANNVFPGLIDRDSVVDAVLYVLNSTALTGQTLLVDNGNSI